MLYVLHVGAWKSSLLAKGFPTLNKIPNSQFPKRTQAHTHNTHRKRQTGKVVQDKCNEEDGVGELVLP